jgi:hypothetical protein
MIITFCISNILIIRIIFSIKLTIIYINCQTLLNTSERKRGMDIHQLKQRIDASGKKLVTLGNEYIKSKDEIAARKVLVKMFGEISQQTLLLGEQNAQMDRNQKGLK